MRWSIVAARNAGLSHSSSPFIQPSRTYYLEEAEMWCRRVLDARRRLSGAEDPSTVTSLNNLAVVLHGRGE
jgi:Tetratricopeptide repeat